MGPGVNGRPDAGARRSRSHQEDPAPARRPIDANYRADGERHGWRPGTVSRQRDERLSKQTTRRQRDAREDTASAVAAGANVNVSYLTAGAIATALPRLRQPEYAASVWNHDSCVWPRGPTAVVYLL